MKASKLSLEFSDHSEQAFPLDQHTLHDICCYVLNDEKFSANNVELDIQTMSADEMQSLNRQSRGKDKPTNVLSFRYQQPNNEAITFLGDIVFCPDVLYQEADQQLKMPDQHATHLLVHALLHLLGYDHDNHADAEIMESKEIAILADLNWPNPYEESQG